MRKIKNYIITLFFALFAINNTAQQIIPDNETLSSFNPAKTEVLAKKSIVLKPGFSSTGHNSFHAWIDPLAPIGTNPGGPVDEVYESGIIDGMNYIKTYSAYKDYQISDPNSLSISNSNIAYQYFDGLGRPVQTVQVGVSPEGRDVVQPIVYDDFGRVAEEYLPYAVKQNGSSAGGFRPYALEEQENCYEHFFKEGGYALSKKEFDGSPLNRVMETLGPGKGWHTDNKKVTVDYGANTATEVIIWSVDASGNLQKGNDYAAGELYKTTTTDEDGKTSVEYKNKQGQVILTVAKDAVNGDAKTYYVYDDFGLLRWVLPPKASANGNISATEKTELCYYYEYDKRKRMTLKSLPGAAPIKMVYDQRDLLVATQDGEHAPNNWIITKYDAFSRPILTGKYTYTGTDDLQTHVNGLDTLWESYDKDNDSYTNNAFPAGITEDDIYSVTYYDDDDFVKYLVTQDAGYDYKDVYGVAVSDKTKGLIMATKTRVLWHNSLKLGDEEWLYTINYYDKYGRVIQTIADNHKGGRDIISNKYNFTGELLESKQEHTNSNIIIDKQFTYDRMGRLQWEKEDLNGAGNWVTTSSNEYNELGQLKTNTIGGKQTVDYQYNIRGWMTHINDPASLGSDLFAMQLKYNDGNSKLYNGNIAQIDWKSKTFGGLKSYEFTYDALNRLDIANFANDDYKVEYDYDLNGNITSLVRHGKKSDESFGLIDNLSYTYNGNQLIKVDDAESQTEGFSDNGSTVATEYFYNDNGNLTRDLNKKIESITYNHLNLPDRLQIFTDQSHTMDYIYDAAGIKLRKEVLGVTTDYIGNFIYQDDVLKYILTSNGRIVVEGSTYNYQYHIKDHLGNTRVTFDATGNVLQEDSYYPFGMAMNGLDTVYAQLDPDNKNKYLYNGKELQDDLGLDWYDYGARFYDAQLGRFHVVDPLAEEYFGWTPYNYVANNPILLVDPNGMEWVNPYQRELDKERKKENPNEEKIAQLEKLAQGVNDVLDALKENDKELYDFIDGLQYEGYNVYVSVYLSNESEGSLGETGDTKLSLSGGADGKFYIKGKGFDDKFSGEDIMSKPKTTANTINILLFNNKDVKRDETLANEAGDVMFTTQYPSKAYQDAKVAKGVTNYLDLHTTHYSFAVENVYQQKKRGTYQSNNAYPLILITKTKFTTQDGKKTIERKKK